MKISVLLRTVLVGMALTIGAASAQAHGTHIEAPWDRDYSGTWDLECESVTFNAGAVFWLNGVGILPIPLGTMPGVCVPGVGVEPDPVWVETHVTQPLIELCENIDAYANQVGTLVGFTEACTEAAERFTEQFITTVRDASPQPWDAYYTNWISTYWHPWGTTYIFPNPLANDPHQDYRTLGGLMGTTGNTVLGWAIDGIANGLTLIAGNAISIELTDNVTLNCSFGDRSQASHQVYTTNDTVQVTNIDVVSSSCIATNDTFLGQFGVQSSGFVVAGDVETVLSGVRVSRENILDQMGQ